MNLIKKYILSYDTIIALILTALCVYFFPKNVGGDFLKDVLNMGIGVLSIVFSIFFAALAFIISSSDDEFVSFLEEFGLFTKLINTFKWTVASLFFSLLYTIVIYVVISFQLSQNRDFKASEYLIALFCFLFFYSLIATILSTNDAIKYSHRRIKFVKKKKFSN